MIAFVKGRLAHKDPTHVIIDVNGIGYQLNISLATFADVKDQEHCELFTHFHVKEDAQTLYGFSTKGEKETFLHLISVNGVGPSTALMTLSSLSNDELKHAILSEDVATVQSVKGIGAKTAQRIILELKDKMKKDFGDIEVDQMNSISYNTVKQEALVALTTLGFNKAAAEKSIDRIIRKEGNEVTLESVIKQALKTA